MEPVDFRTADQARPASPELARLRHALRNLLSWIALALLAWPGLAALLAAMDLADTDQPELSVQGVLAHLRDPALATPLRVLARQTADTLFWPLVVLAAFLLLRGLLGEFLIRLMLAKRHLQVTQVAMPDHGEQAIQGPPDGAWRMLVLALQTLRIIPMAATAFALIWAAMAAFAFADGRNHWEALPWVTPPYLAEFLTRHPGISAERGGDTSGKLTLSDGQGHAVRLYGSEVAKADLRLEACATDPGPAPLGGITPYPGMTCNTQARLRGPDGEQTIYLFTLPHGSDVAAMEAHFRRWIDDHASGSASTSGGGQLTLSAGTGDGASHLELNARQGGASTLVIRRRH